MATLARIAGATLALLLAVPFTTQGQPPSRLPRVGCLVSTGTAAPLWEGLRALDYIEGKTILFEHRSADGRVDRLPALAAELIHLNVNVIVAGGPEPLEAVRRATSRIPIVMVARGDPVAGI